MLNIKTEITTNEIPSIYESFCSLIGENHWVKRTKEVKQQIKGHKYLEDYLKNENNISFSLSEIGKLIKNNKYINNSSFNNNHYSAVGFAAQILSIMPSLSKENKSKIIRRIHGGFRNPVDIRAFQLELLAATHFVHNGYEITWPEMEGSGNFDLFVNDIGAQGLQVECKTISGDKGKRIHKKESLDFYHELNRIFKKIGNNLNTGLIVKVTLPKRLPKAFKEICHLSNLIKEQILLGKSEDFNEISIRIEECDFSEIEMIKNESDIYLRRDRIDIFTNTQNKNTGIITGKNGGVIVILQSKQDDTIMSSMFNTLNESAKNQINPNLPAMFLVGLHDIGYGELQEIAHQEYSPDENPTALQLSTSKFLNKSSNNNFIAVSFIDKSYMGTRLLNEPRRSGNAFIYKNEDSSFWSQEFSNLLNRENKLTKILL